MTTLYFESLDKRIYFETNNKYRYRQKLCVFTMTLPIDGKAFFEVKQKHKKVVNKRRMVMPLKEAYRYLTNNLDSPLREYETSNTQVLREIHYKNFNDV
ncbi:VTC domain-containing protein [Lederbergia panacisoli]|uniref:VTC domain-containing protein n=1 Tax=Lederbergia panacisoli TaxID=1255251 RepID=UPI00214C84C1|nr:VTC domain-containing protein [Lederbergia panacisoli]MCR2821663.1 VTC domain-containing protein [Lederbergia panacisoli]